MKRSILGLFIVAGIASTANAQSHSILLYGDVNYDENNIKGSGHNGELNSAWLADIGIGYQFNKHFTAGLQGSYTKKPYAEDAYYIYYSPMDFNITNWNAGAFGRYTQSIGSIFFMYGQLNLSYANISNNASGGIYYPLGGNNMEDYLNDATGFQAILFPGVGVNIYKGFALNMSVGGVTYSSMKQKEPSYTVNHFNINFGQEVNIGVSKNFGGHSRRHKEKSKEEES